MTEDIALIIVISIVGGLIAAAITCFSIYKKYKTKLKAPVYPVEHYTSLELSSSSDNFVGRTVTRVRVNNSSNHKR